MLGQQRKGASRYDRTVSGHPSLALWVNCTHTHTLFCPHPLSCGCIMENGATQYSCICTLWVYGPSTDLSWFLDLYLTYMLLQNPSTQNCVNHLAIKNLRSQLKEKCYYRIPFECTEHHDLQPVNYSIKHALSSCLYDRWLPHEGFYFWKLSLSLAPVRMWSQTQEVLL